MNNGKTAVYQGVTMHACWPKMIQNAQKKTHFIIKGKPYERIPYGEEDFDWGDDMQPCHDLMFYLDSIMFHFVMLKDVGVVEDKHLGVNVFQNENILIKTQIIK